MSSSKAVIFGCKGPNLTSNELVFFSKTKPIGFILFARNCVDPEQLRKLIKDLRKSINNDYALILIDQEGGRVARLQKPHWREPPAAKLFADLAIKNIDLACEALNLNIRLVGQELRGLGINVNCLPVLDIPFDGADPIISDRAFGVDPEMISILGRVACEALLMEGVLPVIKHIPGHGRANVDSHKALPTVRTDWAELSKNDFLPFKLLADMPIAMTAHIIYSAIDPENPATTSTKIILDIIREEIGFDGLLISDDLSMKALDGDFSYRTQAALAAGCDAVLHCNGDMSEMKEISDVVFDLSDKSADRLERALVQIDGFKTLDRQVALERLAELGIN
jgi:beta-N-acetylhexosaminidase